MNAPDRARRSPLRSAPIAMGLMAMALCGCRSLTDAGITGSQNAELKSDVAAYHACVAHTAARIDDGHAPIRDVADAAMDRCLPQAQEVSKLLDSTELPDSFKSQYLDELFSTASRQSAVMLRRLRNPDWDNGVI